MRNRWPVALLVAASVTVVSCGGTKSQPSGTANPKRHSEGTQPAKVAHRVAIRNYRVGECVTLPRESASSIDAKTVACAKPHEFEIAGQATVGSDVVDYPSTAEWKLLISQLCEPVVAQYLGGTLDPRGRFLTGAIHPLQTIWDLGDHTLDCAVIARPQNQSEVDHPPSMTGAARGASQTVTFPIGSCIPLTPTGAFGFPGDCSAPHVAEVTGVADITGRIDHAPAAHELDAFLGPTCKLLATQYIGHVLDGDLSSAWFVLDPESWNAGRREVQCIVAHGPTSAFRTVSGEIRSGA